jgi:hypothetical protein
MQGRTPSMLDEQAKQNILSEILESPEFKDSRRYQELLKYLVRETLAGNAPKEITIATAFFQKEWNFDPKEDPTVRVYLNNLRKKLEHHYLTSEKVYTHRLEIPRGRYQVEFAEVEPRPQTQNANSTRPWALPAAVLVTAVVVSLFFLITRHETRPATPASNPIWSEFLTPGGRPTMVVLGDFFFLFERTPEGPTRNFVRNINVNSPDDFKQMIKVDQKFAERFVQSDFTFLRPSASWGLAEILPLLQQSPNRFSLKLASQFTVDDLKSNNVVFIGSFKTLYTLQKFLHIFGLDYKLSPSQVNVRMNATDSLRVFSPTDIKGGSYEKDYAVIAKATGPNESTILLLLGFSDSGVIEATRAVTDQKIVSTITSELARDPLQEPFHFTLVVDTEGYKQEIFKSQVRYFVQRHLPQESVSNKEPAAQTHP